MANAPETKTIEITTPSWTKVLPLLGLAAGGYYAYHQKGNVGQILLYAVMGGWALSAPAVYYTVEGIKGGVKDSLTEKKPA